MLYKLVRVAENQRVFWYMDGNFKGVLAPGTYRFWKRTQKLRFESYDVTEGEVVLPNIRYLVREHAEVLNPYLEIFSLGQSQVALVSVNKLARRLALPGEVIAFWKDSTEYTVQIIDLGADIAVPAEWVQAINRSGDVVSLANLTKAMLPITVAPGHETILLVDGVINRTLQPGRYAFWKVGRELKTMAVDKRVQEIEVNGQEILTRDRVSLRANASLQYRIVDAVTAVVDTPDVAALAYRSVQFALRRMIGAMTLDELLADKTALADQVQTQVTTDLAERGLQVIMVGIKDVVLPGEMKTILNQVVEAQKVAEANAIRRQDETQSVRALANTARQLEGNAMMARLKELEALQSVTSSVNTLNVYNGLDGVMGQLVNLKD